MSLVLFSTSRRSDRISDIKDAWRVGVNLRGSDRGKFSSSAVFMDSLLRLLFLEVTRTSYGIGGGVVAGEVLEKVRVVCREVCRDRELDGVR